jgi:alpha-1,3-mannosyltransferase
MPLDIASHLDVRPTRLSDASSMDLLAARGKALWNKTHRPYDDHIKCKLAEAHPDLPVFIINHEYGFLLAGCDGVASSRARGIRTSLAAIACLRVQGAAQPQLFGHIHGLRKAWVDGSWNSVAEPDTEEAFQWLVSDPGCRWLLDTTDEIVHGLNSGIDRTACVSTRSKI